MNEMKKLIELAVKRMETNTPLVVTVQGGAQFAGVPVTHDEYLELATPAPSFEAHVNKPMDLVQLLPYTSIVAVAFAKTKLNLTI